MTKAHELVGMRFNRLTVMSRVENSNKGTSRWLCLCDCGSQSVVGGTKLVKNLTKSCGCIVLEMISNLNKSHGMTDAPTYNTWRGMRERCTNVNNSHYSFYGGRGITICDRWLESFENFYEDMGEKPEGLTLERIDIDGNYCPENCKWDTPTNQAYNTSKKSNNTSGRTGVGFKKEKQKYFATISKDKQHFWLGFHDTFEEAVEAREKAELELYGFTKK